MTDDASGAEAAEAIRRVLDGIDAGILDASPMQTAYLRGALDAVDLALSIKEYRAVAWPGAGDYLEPADPNCIPQDALKAAGIDENWDSGSGSTLVMSVPDPSPVDPARPIHLHRLLRGGPVGGYQGMGPFTPYPYPPEKVALAIAAIQKYQQLGDEGYGKALHPDW